MTVTAIEILISPSLAGPVAVEPHRSALAAIIDSAFVTRYPGAQVSVDWLDTAVDEGRTQVVTEVEDRYDPHPTRHAVELCDRLLWDVRTPMDGVRNSRATQSAWLATLPYDHSPGVLVSLASTDDACDIAVAAYQGDGFGEAVTMAMVLRPVDDAEADALRAASGVRVSTVTEVAEGLTGESVHPFEGVYLIPPEALAA